MFPLVEHLLSGSQSLKAFSARRPVHPKGSSAVSRPFQWAIRELTCCFGIFISRTVRTGLKASQLAGCVQRFHAVQCCSRKYPTRQTRPPAAWCSMNRAVARTALDFLVFLPNLVLADAPIHRPQAQ